MAEAGAKGNVEEAQEMMKGVEGMRQEREAIKSAQSDESRKKIFLVSIFHNKLSLYPLGGSNSIFVHSFSVHLAKI